jgi:hypothetical protein
MLLLCIFSGISYGSTHAQGRTTNDIMDFIIRQNVAKNDLLADEEYASGGFANDR